MHCHMINDLVFELLAKLVNTKDDIASRAVEDLMVLIRFRESYVISKECRNVSRRKLR